MANLSISSDGSDFLGFETETWRERLSDLSDGPDLSDNESSFSSDDNEETENDGENSGNAYYGKNRFKWSENAPERRSRPVASNIVQEVAGPKGAAKNLNDVTPLSIWSLFITDVMLEKSVKNTNVQIALQRNHYKSTDNVNLKDTDLIELKALIGLLYYSSVFKGNHESILSLFATDGTGRDIFRCIMSRNRFTFLLDCLRFDDRSTREQRKIDDPAYFISDFFDGVMQNSQELYTLGPNTCIDEMVIGFRGRCKFRIYMPMKPAKYGIKLLLLTDTDNSYVYSGYIYTGKGSDGLTLPERDKKFQVPTQSVLRLVKKIKNTNRNVTADNWFTSIEVDTELRKRGSTRVGTVKKNKKEVPLLFRNTKKREVGNSLCGYTNELTLLSYVPKKNEVVPLLSPMHHSAETHENGKPRIIDFYNHTKTGVDAMDQKCANYSSSRRIQRWPMALFHGTLAITINQAYILYKFYPSQPKLSRLEFNKQVADSLVLPHLQRKNIKRLPRDIQSVIVKFLPNDHPQNMRKANSNVGDDNNNEGRTSGFDASSLPKKSKKRCSLCPRNDKKFTRPSCFSCSKAVCETCSETCCRVCLSGNYKNYSQE